MRTLIGFLRKNDEFMIEGKKYRVGKIIKGTNGYVACVCVENNKVKRFNIDLSVEICKKRSKP